MNGIRTFQERRKSIVFAKCARHTEDDLKGQAEARAGADCGCHGRLGTLSLRLPRTTFPWVWQSVGLSFGCIKKAWTGRDEELVADFLREACHHWLGMAEGSFVFFGAQALGTSCRRLGHPFAVTVLEKKRM